jgi:hypothetical protein
MSLHGEGPKSGIQDAGGRRQPILDRSPFSLRDKSPLFHEHGQAALQRPVANVAREAGNQVVDTNAVRVPGDFGFDLRAQRFRKLFWHDSPIYWRDLDESRHKISFIGAIRQLRAS